MIICPPDCPERKQGCHSQCEKYKEKLADLHARKEWLNKDRTVVGQLSDGIRRRNNIVAKRKAIARAYGSRTRRF